VKLLPQQEESRRASVFGPREQEVTREQKKLHSEDIRSFYP